MGKKFDFDEDHISRVCEMIIKVKSIYEEAGGEPEVKPAIECPTCLKLTTGYTCVWRYNNHVHFHCDHCDSTIIQ